MTFPYRIFVLFLCGSVYSNYQNVSSDGSPQLNITSDIYGNNSSNGVSIDPNSLFSKFDPILFSLVVINESVQIFSPTEYPTSDRCSAQRGRILAGLQQREVWAMLYFDAMGKPSSGVVMGNTVMMGSYDLCVSIKVDNDTEMTGSFLRLTFKADVPMYLPWQTQGSQETGLPLIYWFICLPSGCSQDDAGSIAAVFANKSGVQLVDTVMLRAKDPTGDKGFITAVVILSVLGGICLIGTVVDVCVSGQHKRVQADQSPGEVLNAQEDRGRSREGVVITGMRVFNDSESGQVSSSTTDKQQILSMPISTVYNTGMTYKVNDSKTDSNGSRKDDNNTNQIVKTRKKKSKLVELLLQFFLAFSLQSNLADIFKAKHAPGDIRCLHGIRVMTISWVFLGHCYYQAPQVGNLLTVLEMTKWWTIQGVIGGAFAVDTFFMLSGCLVAYLFLRTAQKYGKVTCSDMILYYVHRYLRLTPLYALVILFYTGITQYFESGPFAKPVYERDVNCRSFWWWNILYISNFIKGEEMCLVWSWYLADDMQYYVVAPLVVVPIALGYLYPGIVVALLMLACHIISYAVLEDIYKGTLYQNLIDYYTKLYTKPWTRVGPYAVGLILGIILFKRMEKQKLSKVVAIIGWILALGSGLILVYVPYDNFKDNGLAKAKWGQASITSYETLKSPAWATCVAWVVFACFSNCGGFIDSFLSWQAWIPLSKLTFGAYLFHMMIMHFFNNNARILNYFSIHYVIERFICIFALSFGMSLIFSLLIETPVRNLIKPLANLKKEKQNNTNHLEQKETQPTQEKEQGSTKPHANWTDYQQIMTDANTGLEDYLDHKNEKFHMNEMHPLPAVYHNNGFVSDCGHN